MSKISVNHQNTAGLLTWFVQLVVQTLLVLLVTHQPACWTTPTDSAADEPEKKTN